MLRSKGWRGCRRYNDVDLSPNELCRDLGEALLASLPPTIFDGDSATLDPAEFTQPLHKGGNVFASERTRILAQESDGWQLRSLLRSRSDRPRDRRAAEQRYQIAASHCPMPPVLPTERIAHLGTADCCIHPPGRNEMIAITPPKIFSKEVAQNRPPHLPRQQPPSPPKIVLGQISGDEAWMKI